MRHLYASRHPRRSLLIAGGTVLVVVLALIAALTRPQHSHGKAAAPQTARTSSATADADPAPLETGSSSQPSTSAAGPPPRPLASTSSADAYAAAVAKALWTVGYSRNTRDQLLAFWRGEIAAAVPAGTPAGTTLADARAASLSTVEAYIPTQGAWEALAADRTTGEFAVTSVSEPSSWVQAIAANKIIDPGLTARTVVGIQTTSYGPAAARHTVKQTQQVTVAMLCPPTQDSCRVEVLPPVGSTGVSG